MKMFSLTSLGLALLCSPTFADEPAAPPTASAKSVIVHEDDWTKLLGEPERLMKSAQESYVGKKADEAAADIEKAAAYVKTSAANATPAAEAALKKSAAELSALAVKIKDGATIGRRQMGESFARANQAMAVEHHAKAEQAMKAGDAARAGSYLHRAASDVESAAKWFGHKWEAGAEATLQGAKDLGPKLTDGADFAVKEVSKALTFVGDETKKLGRYLEPK